MKKLLINILFWLHVILLAALIIPFFIPVSIWPERITLHFLFLSSILLLQLIWGAILLPKIRKIDFICPLTTWMQYLRGYPISSKKNHEHSFMAEFLHDIGIKISFQGVTILQTVIFSAAAILYFARMGGK